MEIRVIWILSFKYSGFEINLGLIEIKNDFVVYRVNSESEIRRIKDLRHDVDELVGNIK